MYVCSYVHMYVYYMYAVSKDAEEGVRSLGDRVTIVMSHYMSWESNLGPLQEQQCI